MKRIVLGLVGLLVLSILTIVYLKITDPGGDIDI